MLNTKVTCPQMLSLPNYLTRVRYNLCCGAIWHIASSWWDHYRTVGYSGSHPHFAFSVGNSKVTLESWWEYLCHRNQHTLQIRGSPPLPSSHKTFIRASLGGVWFPLSLPVPRTWI